MAKFLDAAKDFSSDADGVSMVEYCLMLALIAVVCIVVIGVLGSKANSMFSTFEGSL